MLAVLGFLLDFIDRWAIWLYIACLAMIAFYVRAYLVARRDQENSIFTVEKEVAAHKQGRAMSGIGTILGIMVVITALKFYVLPSVDLAALVEFTPTATLPVPTRAATNTPTLLPTPLQPTSTPTSKLTRSPLPTPTLIATSTATPQGSPAQCPDPNVRITSPRMNAVVSGRLAIRGTANHERFQFYKVEYGQGEKPTAWHVISDIHKTAITNGILEELDTKALPNGVYWLQLTVVDQSGNFPPPCQVRIVIQN